MLSFSELEKPESSVLEAAHSSETAELSVTLDDDAVSNLCCQFPISADYDGLGARGTKIVFLKES